MTLRVDLSAVCAGAQGTTNSNRQTSVNLVDRNLRAAWAVVPDRCARRSCKATPLAAESGRGVLLRTVGARKASGKITEVLSQIEGRWRDGAGNKCRRKLGSGGGFEQKGLRPLPRSVDLGLPRHVGGNDAHRPSPRV